MGILIEGNSNPVITGCAIDNNRVYGIYSWGTSSPVITRNTFADNGSYAAYLCCAKGICVSDNTVNTLDNIANTLDNTVNTLDNNHNSLDNTVNTLDTGVNILDNTVNTLDTGVNTLDNTTEDSDSIAEDRNNIAGNRDNIARDRNTTAGDNTGDNTGDSSGKIYLLGTISTSGRLGHNPGCPYVIDNLTIAEGATLTIEPGAVIKGDNLSSRLTVNGTLVAKGTDQAPIVFTSLRDDTCAGDTNNDRSNSLPAAGDWDGIFFSDTSNDSACVLNHCRVRYAGCGSQGCAISFSSASPSVRHCTISHNRAYGLRLQDASPTISKCSITHNNHSGILIEGNSNPVITGCNIDNNRAYGICSWGTSSPVITHNTFADNSFYAVSACCNKSVSISDNTVNGNGGGIYLLGTITEDTHLANNPDCSYVLDNLTIAEGATLTIEPGIVIKGSRQCNQMFINGGAEGAALWGVGGSSWGTSVMDENGTSSWKTSVTNASGPSPAAAGSEYHGINGSDDQPKLRWR